MSSFKVIEELWFKKGERERKSTLLIGFSVYDKKRLRNATI
jgi:hypothetical protein